MIIFYKKSTGNILSYVSYTLVYDGETLINRPSLEKISEQHSIDISDLGIKNWAKVNPEQSDFKDNVDDLDSEDLEEI